MYLGDAMIGWLKTHPVQFFITNLSSKRSFDENETRFHRPNRKIKILNENLELILSFKKIRKFYLSIL